MKKGGLPSPGGAPCGCPKGAEGNVLLPGNLGPRGGRIEGWIGPPGGSKSSKSGSPGE